MPTSPTSYHPAPHRNLVKSRCCRTQRKVWVARSRTGLHLLDRNNVSQIEELHHPPIPAHLATPLSLSTSISTHIPHRHHTTPYSTPRYPQHPSCLSSHTPVTQLLPLFGNIHDPKLIQLFTCLIDPYVAHQDTTCAYCSGGYQVSGRGCSV